MEKILFMILITVALAAGCRPGHDLASSHFSQSNQTLDCKAGSTSGFNPNDNSYPKARRYIQEIAEFMMRSNPSVFAGEFAPANFCYGIKEDDDFNAFALSTIRTTIFNTGFFKHTSSEAVVAAIMAHELAHITKKHVTPLSYADFKRYSEVHSDADLATVRSLSATALKAEQDYREAQNEYTQYMKNLAQVSDHTLNLIRR